MQQTRAFVRSGVWLSKAHPQLFRAELPTGCARGMYGFTDRM
jgi:hypothetical protein